MEYDIKVEIVAPQKQSTGPVQNIPKNPKQFPRPPEPQNAFSVFRFGAPQASRAPGSSSIYEKFVVQ